MQKWYETKEENTAKRHRTDENANIITDAKTSTRKEEKEGGAEVLTNRLASPFAHHLSSLRIFLIFSFFPSSHVSLSKMKFRSSVYCLRSSICFLFSRSPW